LKEEGRVYANPTSAFEQKKLDEIIKGMFMWNLGGGPVAAQVDLSQGIGLAILS
jgi:hypothetical protein